MDSRGLDYFVLTIVIIGAVNNNGMINDLKFIFL